MLIFLHRGSDSDATWAVCDPSSQRWHCYYCQLMFMWFSCTETYQWSVCTCHLLMLTYFCVVNVPEFGYCFWLFTDIDYFSCAKCSYHFRLMFVWFSCTETYQWSVCTSSSFLIYWCWHIFVSKMFQNFNIVFDYLLMLTIFHVQIVLIFDWFFDETYWCFHVISLYWNILMKCTHFIFICHWLHLHLSLTDVDIFRVVNVPEFQYCFWLFTDVDYFSCANCSHHFRLMFMWFPCTETYWWSVHTSSSFVIDWCWHFFVENILEFQ